jgi:hypothetical protein
MFSASAIDLASKIVASIGLFPTLVSWDKTKTSAPSNTADETS